MSNLKQYKNKPEQNFQIQILHPKKKKSPTLTKLFHGEKQKEKHETITVGSGTVPLYLNQFSIKRVFTVLCPVATGTTYSIARHPDGPKIKACEVDEAQLHSFSTLDRWRHVVNFIPPPPSGFKIQKESQYRLHRRMVASHSSFG